MSSREISKKPTLKSFVERGIRFLGIFVVRSYQLLLSPILGGACRFHPTCSQYALQAFQELPPLEALSLVLKRLSQCHPWGPFGEDPVRPKEIKS